MFFKFYAIALITTTLFQSVEHDFVIARLFFVYWDRRCMSDSAWSITQGTCFTRPPPVRLVAASFESETTLSKCFTNTCAQEYHSLLEPSVVLWCFSVCFLALYTIYREGWCSTPRKRRSRVNNAVCVIVLNDRRRGTDGLQRRMLERHHHHHPEMSALNAPERAFRLRRRLLITMLLLLLCGCRSTVAATIVIDERRLRIKSRPRMTKKKKLNWNANGFRKEMCVVFFSFISQKNSFSRRARSCVYKRCEHWNIKLYILWCSYIVFVYNLCTYVYIFARRRCVRWNSSKLTNGCLVSVVVLWVLRFHLIGENIE